MAEIAATAANRNPFNFIGLSLFVLKKQLPALDTQIYSAFVVLSPLFFASSECQRPGAVPAGPMK
jgi:hypothetical protein